MRRKRIERNCSHVSSVCCRERDKVRQCKCDEKDRNKEEMDYNVRDLRVIIDSLSDSFSL